MNESYEQEIDLKWLMYRMLRAWRTIVIWGIVIAVVLGAGTFTIKLFKINDPEFVEDAKLNFEREYAAWVATGKVLQSDIQNLEEKRDKQQEYNDTSVLMKIDPMHEAVMAFDVYVKYDYQIRPDMVYQNTDLTTRILKGYEYYLTTDLYQEMLGALDYEIELEDLRSVLAVSVDYSASTISIRVKQQNALLCQEIIDIVRSGIARNFESIRTSIAEHTITFMNELSYETKDTALEAMQKANEQLISTYNMSIQTENEEYLRWLKGAVPEYEYTIWETVKNSVKMVIIGGVAGAIAVAAVVVFACLLSGRLLNAEDIRRRYGVRVIGELPAKAVKKPFDFVTRWACKLGGITAKTEDYDHLAKAIGRNIKFDLSARGEKDTKKLAFVGTVPEEKLYTLLKVMKPDGAFVAMPVTGMLSDAEAIEKISTADYVVLVEAQELSVWSDIEKELEALKAWDKKVLGAIVLNADVLV